MNTLRIISRIVIGVLFIFSGFTKAIDPVGTGFVMAEYFKAFGLSFFEPLAVSSGVLQSAVELALGVAVLIGLRMRLSIILSMAIMVFFTFFTLGIAIYHPVSHCGCFGDAIHLTNWATFFKNLIFTPITIFLFVQRKHFVPIAPKMVEWGLMVLFGFLSILLSLYCYRHLPMIDFTGFKVGNNIPQAMIVPPEKQSQYETTFTYKKGSETKTFTIDELPDSSWTYVSAKTKLIKAGAIPAINFFDISTYGRRKYVTDSILSIKGYLLVLSVPYADRAHTGAMEKTSALLQGVPDLPMIAISGSDEAQIVDLLRAHGIEIPAYFSNAKTLYTMVRANPGLTLLYDATIVAKWSAYEVPSSATVKQLMSRDWEETATKSQIWARLSAEIFVVGLALLLALLRFIFRRIYK